MNPTLQALFNGSLIICGCIVIVLILFAVGALISAWFGHIFNRWYERGKQAQYQIDCERIRNHAFWFGESPATVKLIEDLAEGLTDTGRIRDRWRHNVKLETPDKQPES